MERHARKVERKVEREMEELKDTVDQLQRQLDEAKAQASEPRKDKSGGTVDAQAVKALSQDLDKQSKQVSVDLKLPSRATIDSIHRREQYQRAIAELGEAMTERDQLKAQLAQLEKTIQTDARVKEQAQQLKEAALKRSELAGKLGAVEEECAVYRQRVEQLQKGGAALDQRDREKLKEAEERLRKMESKLVVLEGVSLVRRASVVLAVG